MHNRFNNKKTTKGFTIVELMLTMALFALVAGMVLTFIGFMSNFNKTNQRLSKKNSETLNVRQELDVWVSFFDNNNYQFKISTNFNENNSVIITATEIKKPENSFSIAFKDEPDEKNGASRFMIFEYDKDSFRGEVNSDKTKKIKKIACSSIKQVFLFLDNKATNITDNKTVLRFTIPCKVGGNTFVCEILYW